MRNQREPNALTCEQRRWDSPAQMPISEAAQPLYHRVYREIAREIETGMLQPGDRLPSERWFCDEHGVSRATVRRALEELMADGLVTSRGRGSVVTGAAVLEPPNTLMSLSEVARARGLDASARVLGAEVRPATIDEAEAFGIAPGAEVFELRRLRMLDGLPISIDVNRVPLRLLPEAPDMDFSTASLYEALDRAGHAPGRADYQLEARGADGSEAELLDLALGAPVLFATTEAIAEDGRVIDLGRTVYRADRYRFQATLMRRAHRGERETGNEDTRAAGRAGDRRHSRMRRDTGGGEPE